MQLGVSWTSEVRHRIPWFLQLWSDVFDLLFVVQKMLDYLKDKRDVGFFQSLAGLMQSCRYDTHITVTDIVHTTDCLDAAMQTSSNKRRI